MLVPLGSFLNPRVDSQTHGEITFVIPMTTTTTISLILQHKHN